MGAAACARVQTGPTIDGRVVVRGAQGSWWHDVRVWTSHHRQGWLHANEERLIEKPPAESVSRPEGNGRPLVGGSGGTSFAR